MPTTQSLPFGRTSITADQLEELIAVGTAIRRARDGKVKNPETRIQEFISQIPALLEWLEEHGRYYPWRETTDPWKVYVTEIMLQRTRADAVAEIYDEFFNQFPDPKTLGRADDDDIRDIIRTLGFVNHRTRTLNEVVELCNEEGGQVPETLEKLKQPWRVGEYSARACQLFARGKPMALVDANIARVIGRVLGYDMPQQPHKSEEVYALMDALVPADPDVARAFNLAILDLGALLCTPDSPDHSSCPLGNVCVYYTKDLSREE